MTVPGEYPPTPTDWAAVVLGFIVFAGIGLIAIAVLLTVVAAIVHALTSFPLLFLGLVFGIGLIGAWIGALE